MDNMNGQMGNNVNPQQPQMPQQPMAPQMPTNMAQPTAMPQQPQMPTNMAQPAAMPQQPQMNQFGGQPAAMPQQPQMNQFGGQPQMNQFGAQPVMPGAPAPKKSNLPIIIGAVVAAVVIIGVVLYFTVLSGKKLTCSYSEDGMDMEITLKFKSDEVVAATIDITYDLGDYCSYYDEDQLEEMEDQLLDLYANGNGKVTRNGCVFNLKYDADDEALEEFEGQTYEELKKDAEDDGAICK